MIVSYKGYATIAFTLATLALNGKSCMTGSTGSKPVTLWESNDRPCKSIVIDLPESSALVKTNDAATLLPSSSIPPLPSPLPTPPLPV